MTGPMTNGSGSLHLSDADARALVDVEVAALLPAAQGLRAVGKGSLVTYSPKVFIPLTKLCRDVCHYCTFAQPPRRGQRAYMTADEVLAIARAGAEAGCHEALFTLGDKPERRYRVAREELAALGCETTIEYLARMAELVLGRDRTAPARQPRRDDCAGAGASPRRVRARRGSCSRRSRSGSRSAVGPTSARPTSNQPSGSRHSALAGELQIPFTTGILIGIGETRDERIDALLAIRDLHERYGHIQEVIVQNFRAKAGHEDGRSSRAVARRSALDSRVGPLRPRPRP